MAEVNRNFAENLSGFGANSMLRKELLIIPLKLCIQTNQSSTSKCRRSNIGGNSDEMAPF